MGLAHPQALLAGAHGCPDPQLGWGEATQAAGAGEASLAHRQAAQVAVGAAGHLCSRGLLLHQQDPLHENRMHHDQQAVMPWLRTKMAPHRTMTSKLTCLGFGPRWPLITGNSHTHTHNAQQKFMLVQSHRIYYLYM